MDGFLRSGRDLFPILKARRRTPSTTLGITTYVLMVMAAAHLSFAILLTSQQYVGNPLKCHDSTHAHEEICLSNNYYLTIDDEGAETKVFNYFKWTQWIFLAFAVAFLASSYVWAILEDGVVESLCLDNGKALKADEESDKIASQVSLFLDKFHDYFAFYFIKYVVSEILNFSLIAFVTAYYHRLLHVGDYGFSTVLTNYFSPNMADDERTLHNDLVLQTFPREIGCRYSFHSEASQMQITSFRCKVTNQDYNEGFHILGYIVTLACLILYVLNVLFIAFRFVTFRSLVKGVPESKGLATLPFKLRLVVLNLGSNYDRYTYQLVLTKMAEYGLKNHYERSRVMEYLSRRNEAREHIPLGEMNGP